MSGLTARYAQLEQNFSAVERLYQMEDETPQEVDTPTAIPRPNWPQYGFIKVKVSFVFDLVRHCMGCNIPV